ncbi:MAG: putative neutral zinc metallopeptidase [Schumannella sp.]|nr:putative neutral zinc metallopeptidase [Schumannella sp.]
MTFNEGSDISGGRTSRRGRNTAIGVGGGGLGILAIVLIGQLLGVDLSPLVGGTGSGGGGTGPDSSLEQCQTGADANKDLDCRMKGAAASLEVFWADTLDSATPTSINLFTGATNTGCGQASSAVGPFYCPPDQQIYVDTAFFDQLRTQFGSSGGPLAQLYVVGHEWGHHIQNITGLMKGLDLQTTGPSSDGVRLELQADCFAGAWIKGASTTVDENGTPFLNPPTDAQITDALSAASAVGDDNIQEATQGQVQPETWTHGSSESRQKWFLAGYNGGVQSCDTFGASAGEL